MIYKKKPPVKVHKSCFFIIFFNMYGRIKNILLWKGYKKPVSIPVSELGGSSKKNLALMLNKEKYDDIRRAKYYRDAMKNPFAREFLDEFENSTGPQMDALIARDNSAGNMGSPEISASPTGYVFKANADACPRCLMFDGTWVANPIDAQLLSHPGCRCSVVPRESFSTYQKDFGIDTETAAQNNRDYGHSLEATPWVNLVGDYETKTGKNNSFWQLTPAQKRANGYTG